VVSGDPFLEDERARADHVLTLGKLALGVLVGRDRRRVGVAGLERRLALDAEHGKGRGQLEVGLRVLRAMTTVCSSGAVTEATLEAVPKPPKTAP